MKYIKMILLGATLALSACSTTYYTYSGSPVYTGQGGASKNVNGIDFWVIGTPPRKYCIIGYIQDSRKAGIIEMATRDSNIAAKAKAAGGDAVIATADFARQVAAQFNANTSAFVTQTTIPILWRGSQYLVIKYLN